MVTVALLALVELWALLDPPGRVAVGPVWAMLLVSCALAFPVLARRRWPLAAFAVALVIALTATVAGAVGGGVVWIAYLPSAVALYPVAVAGRTWRSLAVLGAAITLATGAILAYYRWVLPGLAVPTLPVEVPVAWPVEIGLVTVLLGGAAGIGGAVARRRRIAAHLVAESSRRAVAEERLRIARELHDVVGHSLSLIAVQATVANHLGPGSANASSALRTIESTSRGALAEVRRVLGALRSDAELTPIPGPADLPGLAAGSGLAVDLTLRGDRELPAGLGLTVYRIVQEALTNVLRHAGTGSCRVLVDRTGPAVLVEVLDDGRGGEPSGSGNGLLGLRERAALFGGTLSAGPRPEGGFALAARIPIDAEEAR
ncbi:sensor histidine kinase [Crossiella sp. SN42]|uniref:sensor histidine kinase n=1 Tax=Crossiella sp. SN42 TaxID=2944808 RepID=UPI00207D2862|nr:sensor histidine kinase [Crossiella sp. SN42]MCO1582545.1 sensor histidine kinase [Crossiella sp. SN42]